MMRYDEKRGMWLFSDAVEVSTSDIKVDLARKTLADDIGAGLRDTLAIEMAITHSDFVNLNHRRYLGSAMQKSVDTWLKPYPKPVICTHDISSQEPIGRMYAAEFKAEPGIGISENIQGADKEGILKFLKTFQPTNKPSGHIYAGFYVADKDAIEKWLDGRYQTVSVGFATKEAYCSVCGANFATMTMDEAAEHEHIPGRNGCHIVVGDTTYEHLGIVNTPADEYTYVAKMRMERKLYGDAIAPKTFIFNSQKILSLGDEAAKPMSEITPTPTEVKILWPTDAKLLLEADAAVHRIHYVTSEVLGHTHRVILDPATNNGYASYAADHSHDVTANKIAESYPVRDWSAPLGENGEYPVKLAAHTHELGEQVEPLVDSAETKYIHEYYCESTFSEEDSMEAMLLMEDHFEKTEDELVAEGLLEKDAKLTAAQRKDMAASTFCGPGRSFPVNDCAHYTAALRLLNRYKGSEATKQKIHACIMRKGKSLGCTKSKDETETKDVPLDVLLQRTDVKSHIEGLLSEKTTLVDTLTQKVASLEAKVAELTEKIETMTAEAAKKDEDLSKINESLTGAKETAAALTDQNVKYYRQYKEALVDQIITKSLASNKGPVAELLTPSVGESVEERTEKVRIRLAEEPVNALLEKLANVEVVKPLPVEKLEADEFGNQVKDADAAKPAASKEPVTIESVFSK